jgi:hypothetical protein
MKGRAARPGAMAMSWPRRIVRAQVNHRTRLAMPLRHTLAAAAFAALSLVATHAQTAVSVTGSTLSYAQSFDSLPNVNGADPAWTNNGTLPGWFIFSGPLLDTPVTNLRVSTTSGSDRAHISYGINAAADRALGSQGGSSHRYSPVTPAEGEAFGAIAVAFANDTGTSIVGFSFGYTGEQWHVSSNAGIAHSLTMAWALGAPSTAFNALAWSAFTPAQANAAGASFVTPTISGGTTGNGNLAANRTVGLGATVTGIDWAPGQRLWLRWVDLNDPASDHGLAVDDFSFVATPVPEAGALPMMAGGLALLALLAHRRRRGG